MFICKVGTTGGLDRARRQAQTNADRDGQVWVIFSDSSGNIRIEPQRIAPSDIWEAIKPNPR